LISRGKSFWRLTSTGCKPPAVNKPLIEEAKTVTAKILAALPSHRASELLQLLDGKNQQVFLASNFQEAIQKLSAAISYDLLLADAEFPDGSWQNLLQFLLESKKPCEMILCSRCGDEQLWAEALQCGVYDLLVEPYGLQEVYRIIESALDSGYMRRFSAMKTARAS